LYDQYIISQLWFLPEVFEKCFTCDGRALSLREEEDGRDGTNSQLIRTPVTNEYLFTADACKGGQQKTWNVRQSGTNVSLYGKFRNFLQESPEY